MQKHDHTPLWVFLAFSSVETRKTATLLTWATFVIGLAFVPLPLLLDDWSWGDVLEWSGMMWLMTLWYGLALRWANRNNAWDVVPAQQDQPR